MSHTYTPTAAVTPVGTVISFVEPDDGDLASAASANGPTESIGDVLQYLVNNGWQIPPGAANASVASAHVANGLIFQTEAVNGIKTRVYAYRGSRHVEFLMTTNASYGSGGGGRWTADVQTENAWMMSMFTPFGSPGAAIMTHDTSGSGGTWVDSGWTAAYLSEAGTTVAAGFGVLSVQPKTTFASGAYANGYSIGTPGVSYMKDPTGEVTIAGSLSPGSGSNSGQSALVLPGPYWPTQDFEMVTHNTGYVSGTQRSSVLISHVDGSITPFYGGSGVPTSIYLDGIHFR